MANYRAIATTSNAILRLIEDHCPKSLVVGPSFELVHAKDYDDPKKTTEGFTLCLYRISTNGTLRNLPPRRGPGGITYRPSLPLDLHYLLTPWAGDPQRQQLLLGWVMRFFEDYAILPAAVLNSYTHPDAFRPDESVELVCDPLPPADHFALWDKLKPHMQASVTYVARMVLLDSDVETGTGERVQTRMFRTGDLVAP